MVIIVTIFMVIIIFILPHGETQMPGLTLSGSGGGSMVDRQANRPPNIEDIKREFNKEQVWSSNIIF